jgi:hypothetical protein
MEKDIGDFSKFRRSDSDRKYIRKFLAYYRNLREMKNKRSGYKERYKIYNLILNR